MSPPFESTSRHYQQHPELALLQPPSKQGCPNVMFGVYRCLCCRRGLSGRTGAQGPVGKPGEQAGGSTQPVQRRPGKGLPAFGGAGVAARATAGFAEGIGLGSWRAACAACSPAISSAQLPCRSSGAFWSILKTTSARVAGREGSTERTSGMSAPTWFIIIEIALCAL
jgi:hypothetical protein